MQSTELSSRLACDDASRHNNDAATRHLDTKSLSQAKKPHAAQIAGNAKLYETMPGVVASKSTRRDLPSANQGNKIARKAVGSSPYTSRSPDPSLLVDGSDPLLVSQVPKKISELSRYLPSLRLRRPSQAAVPRRVYCEDAASDHTYNDQKRQRWIMASVGTLAAFCWRNIEVSVMLLLRDARGSSYGRITLEHLKAFTDESLSLEERISRLKRLIGLLSRICVAVAIVLAAWSIIAAIKSVLDLLLMPFWIILKLLSWLRS